jgi:thiol-disulfide isomerase/thioredoxin
MFLIRHILVIVLFCVCGYAAGQSMARMTHDTVAFSQLDFDAFQKQAKFENKPYFIMFGASWCAPCHEDQK